MKNFLLAIVIVAGTFAFSSCNKDAVPPAPAPPVTTTTPPATTPPTVVVDSLKIGLLAWYQLNNNGADSSGKGNDTYNSYNVTATSNRFNKANSAMYFNGTNSYMLAKDNTALRLNSTDFSMNAWVNMDALNGSYGSEILSKRGLGNNAGWNYSVTGQSDVLNGILVGTSCFQVSGGIDPYAVGTKIISIKQWHMLTLVYSYQTKELRYYLDGVLDNVTPNIPTPSATASMDLFIGQDSQNNNSTNYFFQGSLDELRIYNRVLTTSQIQKLYALTN